MVNFQRGRRFRKEEGTFPLISKDVQPEGFPQRLNFG